jgi:hypothetical protein
VGAIGVRVVQTASRKRKRDGVVEGYFGDWFDWMVG